MIALYNISDPELIDKIIKKDAQMDEYLKIIRCRLSGLDLFGRVWVMLRI
jgi:hypothetical protein